MNASTLHVAAANTYFDRSFGIRARKILPGEYHVDAEDVLLVTVLGSCVSACIRDTHRGVGGMNHFMLPETGAAPGSPASESARYGAYAMEVLVNDLMKLGARRENLEAKVFGGGRVMAELAQSNVGERNSAFVLEYLQAEGIRIAARDLLDIHPRKVYFFTRTGRALVKKLYRMHNNTIVQREVAYRSRLREDHVEGDVELFSERGAAPAGARIKVLIIDDSALVRRVLTDIVSRQPDMTVVGAAPDPLVAREMIRATNPDVLTLDIEMPKMDGLDFLDKLMRLRPMPVLMVSTLTRTGSEATLKALELGAIDFIAKPALDIEHGIAGYAEEIVAKIRVCARVPRRRPAVHGKIATLPSLGNARLTTEKLLFVGASTGGTEAIKEFLQRLPADSPAVLITQHMPPGFTTTFAARLDGLCKVHVTEAAGGERVLPGHAYIAPGGRHLRLGRSGANYVTLLDDGPPINRHKPSVDVLFRSAAEIAGPNAIGVMLTGMGRDGALAMRVMKDAGAYNVAQDEASCVVFGMPKEAIAAGAVDRVLPLTDIAADVLGHLNSLAGQRTRV